MALNRLTGQQELFCLEYVRTGIASDAYRVAYNVGEKTKPNSVAANASRLMAQVKISSRVQQLWDKATDVTLGEVVAGYRQARNGALEDRQHAAVTGAVTGLARVKGFLKDDPSKAGDIHIHFDDLLRGVL
jgi:phage terminase small subunit